MNGNIPRLGTRCFILGISNILLLSGCTAYAVKSDVPCPARPTLEPISVEEQMAMEPSTVLKVATNQLALKNYAKKLEVRAGCELIAP